MSPPIPVRAKLRRLCWSVLFVWVYELESRVLVAAFVTQIGMGGFLSSH